VETRLPEQEGIRLAGDAPCAPLPTRFAFPFRINRGAQGGGSHGGEAEEDGGEEKKERIGTHMMALYVLCDLVGGQNGLKNCWTKILAETLAPLLLGIDYPYVATYDDLFDLGTNIYLS
jgi:hypothetical protein